MKDTFTCIIIDDEPLAISRLEKHIHDFYPNIEIIATYTSWVKALEGLTLMQSDILFLDISIQDRNGMDLVRMVPGLKSEVVFITAYSEYALDAFKLSASAYLLKPFDKVELSRVINKIVKRIMDARVAEQQVSSHMPGKDKMKIAVPHNNTINYVAISDIVYLEAVQGYTRIVTQNEDLLCSYRIGKFAEQLAPHHFYQVHRSYIVNLQYVRKYETSGTLIMAGDIEIPVAKNNRDDFQGMFLKIHK